MLSKDQLGLYKLVMNHTQFKLMYDYLLEMVNYVRINFDNDSCFKCEELIPYYLDYTYFYLSNDVLEQNDLKIAVVLDHSKLIFEISIVACNKETENKYKYELYRSLNIIEENLFPDFVIKKSIYDIRNRIMSYYEQGIILESIFQKCHSEVNDLLLFVNTQLNLNFINSCQELINDREEHFD